MESALLHHVDVEEAEVEVGGEVEVEVGAEGKKLRRRCLGIMTLGITCRETRAGKPNHTLIQVK